MMYRHRRVLFPMAALLLSLPLLVGAFSRYSSALSEEEQRRLAPAPSWPHRLAQLPHTLHATDDWLRDHFGLREELIHLQSMLTSSWLDSGNEKVLIGRDGWFFLFSMDDSLAESAGTITHPELVFQTADMLAAMQHALAARGTQLLVASPPTSATIYPEHLPDWARNHGQPTDYDLLYAALTARGVPALDLRPVLRAEKPHGDTYLKHDSHWAPRGALAAFNAVSVAAGFPEWPFAAEAALGPLTELRDGDLARLLGMGTEVTEPVARSVLPNRPFRQLTADPLSSGEIPGSHPGPTIMVIGDSFSRNLFTNLIALRTSRVVWMHHRFCAFDWKWIDVFKPKQVWYMPTERVIVCQPGHHPAGLSQEVATLDALPVKPR